ncbi:MAG: hypothetical protein WC889_20535 [Myxococcota bacterium]
MKIKRPELAEAGRVAKYALAQTSLMALGATFELASELVPEMQEELKDWDEGRRVSIGVLPAGPYITIQNVGGRIKYLGLGQKAPDLSVLFKNLDSAVLIFAAQIGSATAVAENRICIHGSNSYAMAATRAMAIVQTYLFPGIILKKTFKRAPVLDAKHLLIKARIMGLLVPRLAKVAGR